MGNLQDVQIPQTSQILGPLDSRPAPASLSLCLFRFQLLATEMRSHINHAYRCGGREMVPTTGHFD